MFYKDKCSLKTIPLSNIFMNQEKLLKPSPWSSYFPIIIFNPNDPELLKSLKLPEGGARWPPPLNLVTMTLMLKLMSHYQVNFKSLLYNMMSDLIHLDEIKP